MTVRTDLARKIGLLLLALWAILFTCGALGELFDLAALKRVAVLSFVLVLVVAGCRWKMVRMPLKSFRGPLPELTTAQSGLAR